MAWNYIDHYIICSLCLNFILRRNLKKIIDISIYYKNFWRKNFISKNWIERKNDLLIWISKLNSFENDVLPPNLAGLPLPRLDRTLKVGETACPWWSRLSSPSVEPGDSPPPRGGCWIPEIFEICERMKFDLLNKIILYKNFILNKLVIEWNIEY